MLEYSYGGRNMSKQIQKIKDVYKENKKSSLAWYLALRGIVIIIMILRFLDGDFSSVFLCLLTLILFLIPFWINQKLKIEIPNLLEIIILLFIFSSFMLSSQYDFI